MTIILTAFTLFHVAVGLASLTMALRLLMPDERALWRSPLNLLVAEFLVWIYPIFAFAAVRSAWRAFDGQGGDLSIPLIMSPILWLLVMGTIFAIVDFVEDGVLGNARKAP